MTSSTTTIESLKSEAIKNGIGLGLLSLVLGVISAYSLVDAESMTTIFLISIGIGLIIPLVIAVLFCFDLRKKIGGYWNLRQATSGIFIMFFAAYALSTIGNIVFNKFIEKDMSNRIQNTIVNATTSMMKKQGLDVDIIDKKLAEMDSEFDHKNSGTIMQSIQGHIIGVIIVFVAALLFGALFKRERLLYPTDNS